MINIVKYELKKIADIKLVIVLNKPIVAEALLQITFVTMMMIIKLI